MLKDPEIGSPTGERANNTKEEEERATIYKYSALQWSLGEPTATRSAVFLNIVQKAFDPPPPRFEHHVANFF